MWGIGKRKWKAEWERLWLFDELIWLVISYEVKIWGWKEREKNEKLQEIFEMGIKSGEKYTGAYGQRRTGQR